MNLFDEVLPALEWFRSPNSASSPAPVESPLRPRFERRSDETIRVREGGLAGKELRLVVEATERECMFRLVSKGVALGFCAFELDASRSEAVLWNVVLDPDWQRQGLGSVLVCAALRHLIETCGPISPSIRMVQLFGTDTGKVRLKNIGLGVIIRKLGFSLAPDVVRRLRSENTESILLVEDDLHQPPFYRIMLRGFPSVMVALPVAPDNWHPYGRGSPFFKLTPASPDMVSTWARNPYVIFGNCDYVLRRGGIPALAAGIATHRAEVEALVRRIRPAAIGVRRQLLDRG